jgi:hypothetical protein
MKDQDWTKQHYGITHKAVNNILYSIEDYTNFAQLDIFDVAAGNLKGRILFFIYEFGSYCFNDNDRYWNCGTIEKAIKWAKLYVEDVGAISLDHKDNLKEIEYLLEE